MPSPVILALNAGSSSIKFAIYEPETEPREIARGQVSAIGLPHACIELAQPGGRRSSAPLPGIDHTGAIAAILDHIVAQLGNRQVIGVGHRFAHGGLHHVQPLILDATAMASLERLTPLAPMHQPHNLAAAEATRRLFPDAIQLACFDTAFHRDHPWVNDTFALPRRYYDAGIRRFGFHGLSYDYVTGTLARKHPEIAAGRVVIAHLGNGASMCAVQDGRSVASTMGFTALDGLPMGTRCGQLDPGVLIYLITEEGLTADELSHLLYHESGLKGLSGITGDMRELEASSRPEARQAIDYYVFRIRRELGAMCAVLGGLDALVFCGGIGENSAAIRSQVCAGMDWFGLGVDRDRNLAAEEDISSGPTPIFVIPTDEERVVARALAARLACGQSSTIASP